MENKDPNTIWSNSVATIIQALDTLCIELDKVNNILGEKPPFPIKTSRLQSDIPTFKQKQRSIQNKINLLEQKLSSTTLKSPENYRPRYSQADFTIETPDSEIPIDGQTDKSSDNYPRYVQTDLLNQPDYSEMPGDGHTLNLETSNYTTTDPSNISSNEGTFVSSKSPYTITGEVEEVNIKENNSDDLLDNESGPLVLQANTINLDIKGLSTWDKDFIQLRAVMSPGEEDYKEMAELGDYFLTAATTYSQMIVAEQHALEKKK